MHTCNDIEPTTCGDCPGCSAEAGLCSEYVVGSPADHCKQVLNHAGPHDFDHDFDHDFKHPG